MCLFLCSAQIELGHRDLSSPVTKVSRSPKARFDREHVETFLDSHSREKYVYKSEMELLLKVK
jgi:hypothetical protein